MNINIETECKECGARWSNGIMPTNDKDHILLATELCDCRYKVQNNNDCSQVKRRPNELEVKVICYFRSENGGATLYLEEIVGEDIFIITEWTDARYETMYYYKGLDSAMKVYREKEIDFINKTCDEESW